MKTSAAGKVIDLMAALKESLASSTMADRMDMSAEERRELLERVMAACGDSGRVFAETEMVRDERTVRRWRSGEVPIPDVVVRKLLWMEREAKE